MSDYEDWCEVPKVVMTGNGWCVRINGCDVFDPINQHGCKGLRSFDIVKGLDSKEEAEAFRIQWLREQLPEIDDQSELDAYKQGAQVEADAADESRAEVARLKSDRNELIAAIEVMLLHVRPAKMNAVALNHAHQVISKYKVKP